MKHERFGSEPVEPAARPISYRGLKQFIKSSRERMTVLSVTIDPGVEFTGDKSAPYSVFNGSVDPYVDTLREQLDLRYGPGQDNR